MSTATTTSVKMETLRETVKNMDAMAQDGFSEIGAVAKMALVMLESPDGYRHPEIIAHALRTIWGKADDMVNCINFEAEQVGCNHVDEARARRLAAQAQARQQLEGGAA